MLQPTLGALEAWWVILSNLPISIYRLMLLACVLCGIRGLLATLLR